MEKKKLVIVGDGDTGKTCLLNVYCKGIFPQMSEPTTFDQFKKDVNIDGQQIELTIWDTAGKLCFFLKISSLGGSRLAEITYFWKVEN